MLIFITKFKTSKIIQILLKPKIIPKIVAYKLQFSFGEGLPTTPYEPLIPTTTI